MLKLIVHLDRVLDSIKKSLSLIYTLILKGFKFFPNDMKVDFIIYIWLVLLPLKQSFFFIKNMVAKNILFSRKTLAEIK